MDRKDYWLQALAVKEPLVSYVKHKIGSSASGPYFYWVWCEGGDPAGMGTQQMSEYLAGEAGVKTEADLTTLIKRSTPLYVADESGPVFADFVTLKSNQIIAIVESWRWNATDDGPEQFLSLHILENQTCRPVSEEISFSPPVAPGLKGKPLDRLTATTVDRGADFPDVLISRRQEGKALPPETRLLWDGDNYVAYDTKTDADVVQGKKRPPIEERMKKRLEAVQLVDCELDAGTKGKLVAPESGGSFFYLPGNVRVYFYGYDPGTIEPTASSAATAWFSYLGLHKTNPFTKQLLMRPK